MWQKIGSIVLGVVLTVLATLFAEPLKEPFARWFSRQFFAPPQATIAPVLPVASTSQQPAVSAPSIASAEPATIPEAEADAYNGSATAIRVPSRSGYVRTVSYAPPPSSASPRWIEIAISISV